MKKQAYLYISLAYISLSLLTIVMLCVKGYNSYHRFKYSTIEERRRKQNITQYLLHSLHIPAYLIAAYWYYDSYIHLE